MDLLALVETDLDAMKEDILKINPEIRIFEVSCRTGEGLQEWTHWLDEKVLQAKGKNA